MKRDQISTNSLKRYVFFIVLFVFPVSCEGGEERECRSIKGGLFG